MLLKHMTEELKQKFSECYSNKLAITLFRITGKDRIKFLQGFTTNDMQALKTGDCLETFVLNIKGKILGHGLVLAEEQALFFLGTAGQQEKLIAHLDRYIITEDVQLIDESDKYTAIFLLGKLNEGVHQLLELDQLAAASNLKHYRKLLSGHEAIIVQRTDFCLPVIQLICPEASVNELFKSLKLNFVSDSELNLVRLLSGQPIYGRDLTDENLGQECCRTASAISFHKGCYLGQEPIARIDALGHVNQKLRIVSWEALKGDPFEHLELPIKLTDPDTHKGLGMITSVEKWQNQYVAMGVVKRHVAERSLKFHAKLDTGEIIQLEVDWINAE